MIAPVANTLGISQTQVNACLGENNIGATNVDASVSASADVDDGASASVAAEDEASASAPAGLPETGGVSLVARRTVR